MTCHLVPALTNGFSVLPSPAGVPTVALQERWRTVVFLLGSWTTQFFFPFETMMAKVPGLLQSFGPEFG